MCKQILPASTTGSKINFFYASAKWRMKFFFQSPDGKFWSPKSVRKIVASQRNTKLLKTFLRSKHNFTRERSQESDCHEKKAIE